MDPQVNGSIKRKEIVANVLTFTGAFAWFWFWRPYGLFGGDSEILERAIFHGEWAWKREPLTVALLQLNHQFLSNWLGWPVGNAMSLVSCLAGAGGVLALKLGTRDRKNSQLTWILLLFSGFTLNFYGAIEVYALPTAMIALWILAIQRVGEGSWPNWTIPMAFAGTCLAHLFGVLLFPSLLVSVYFLLARMNRRDRWIWFEWIMAVPVIVLMVGILYQQERNSLTTLIDDALNPGPTNESFLPLWSLKHITIKGYFLWLGTGIALPFAVWKVWRDRYDPVTLQVAVMAGMALVFLALFHPDLGYDDWDLFLFPSLPVAFLAAPVVAQSPKRVILSTIWIGIFITLWLPRIPFWANLSERGLAEVRILNPPADARVRLDDRYPVEGNRVWMGGGMHSLSVWRHGDRIRWKVFRVHPGEELEIRLPEGRAPGPFAEQIKRMQLERDEETRFDQSP
jgi:hypothetical protein